MKISTPILVLLALVSMAGCGKQEDEAKEENPELLAMRERLEKTDPGVKEVKLVTAAIRKFHNDLGTLPKSIQQLKKLEYIDEIPVPEDGMIYHYDPIRGNYQYMTVQRHQQLINLMQAKRY